MRGQIFTLLLLFSQLAFSQNCFTDFKYYRPLKVVNPDAIALTDMQVHFELETASLLDSSKLAVDGSDIRIMDENCTPVPFYVSAISDSGNSTIWMKLASIPANDTLHLQLYYGNDTTMTASNGDDTFIFFDDFSLDSVDVSKWEAVGEFQKFQTNNGVFEYASTGTSSGSRFKFARTTMSFSEEVILEFNAEVSNSNGFGFSSTDTILERIIFRQSGFGFDTLNQVAFNTDTITNGISIDQAYPLIRFPRRVPTDGRLRAKIVGETLNITEFVNTTDNSINTDTFELSQIKMRAFHFIVSSFSSQTIYMDFLRVRKPGGDSVGFVLGMEEVLIVDTMTVDTTTSIGQRYEYQLTIYPNPSQGQISVEGLQAGKHSFVIKNLHGQDVWSLEKNIQSGIERLELPELPEGHYWISVRHAKGFNESHQIMIQR